MIDSNYVGTNASLADVIRFGKDGLKRSKSCLTENPKKNTYAFSNANKEDINPPNGYYAFISAEQAYAAIESLVSRGATFSEDAKQFRTDFESHKRDREERLERYLTEKLTKKPQAAPAAVKK